MRTFPVHILIGITMAGFLGTSQFLMSLVKNLDKQGCLSQLDQLPQKLLACP